jgi:hypothetical protein
MPWLVLRTVSIDARRYFDHLHLIVIPSAPCIPCARYHFHHSGKRIDTKGVASDTIAKHFMRAMHGGAEPKPEQVRVSLSSNGHFSEYHPTLHLDKHAYGLCLDCITAMTLDPSLHTRGRPIVPLSHSLSGAHRRPLAGALRRTRIRGVQLCVPRDHVDDERRLLGHLHGDRCANSLIRCICMMHVYHACISALA